MLVSSFVCFRTPFVLSIPPYSIYPLLLSRSLTHPYPLHPQPVLLYLVPSPLFWFPSLSRSALLFDWVYVAVPCISRLCHRPTPTQLPLRVTLESSASRGKRNKTQRSRAASVFDSFMLSLSRRLEFAIWLA